jgi:hypothetical protein
VSRTVTSAERRAPISRNQSSSTKPIAATVFVPVGTSASRKISCRFASDLRRCASATATPGSASLRRAGRSPRGGPAEFFSVTTARGLAPRGPPAFSARAACGGERVERGFRRRPRERSGGGGDPDGVREDGGFPPGGTLDGGAERTGAPLEVAVEHAVRGVGRTRPAHEERDEVRADRGDGQQREEATRHPTPFPRGRHESAPSRVPIGGNVVL